ncbi:MAG TPA: hypothetical protein VGM03_21790 [Phycisphaerae bacterium]|jgi:hypothetical protein
MASARPQSRSEAAVAELAIFFRRNGYVRWQNRRKLKRVGYMAYKKGDEVRFVADSMRELRIIRRLLRQAGFRPGQPFAHGKQWRQPLYGRAEALRLLELVGALTVTSATRADAQPRSVPRSEPRA